MKNKQVAYSNISDLYEMLNYEDSDMIKTYIDRNTGDLVNDYDLDKNKVKKSRYLVLPTHNQLITYHRVLEEYSQVNPNVVYRNFTNTQYIKEQGYFGDLREYQEYLEKQYLRIWCENNNIQLLS